MNDTLTLGDENLVSSKRASELSGYAQDYIGQLARKGLIAGKRIGGLWYVSIESLNAYKSNADTFKPLPPQATATNDTNAIISFDGRDYVSAARAAQITGYTADYVGQLARGGKLSSRQVGHRWYVDRDQIIAHKAEKDALLGAVQSESVGVSPSKVQVPMSRQYSEPFFKYRTEGRDLMAKPNSDRVSYTKLYEEHHDQVHPIEMRRTYPAYDNDRYEDLEDEHGGQEVGKQHSSRVKIMLAVLLTTVVLLAIGSVVYISLKNSAPKTSAGVPAAQTSAERSGSTNFDESNGVIEWMKSLFGKELIYEKSS